MTLPLKFLRVGHRGHHVMSLSLVLWMGASALAQAENQPELYSPPTSPELYVKEPPSPPQRLTSEPYVGVTIGSGQSRSSQGDPVASYDYGLLAGYRKTLDSWSFVEAGGELARSRMGHSQADFQVPLRLCAYAGYGRKVAGQVYGVTSFSGGFMQAHFDHTTEAGVHSYTTSPVNGSLWQVAYRLHARMSEAPVELWGGGLLGYGLFNVKGVSTQEHGVTYREYWNKSMTMYLFQIHLGARWAIGGAASGVHRQGLIDGR